MKILTRGFCNTLLCTYLSDGNIQKKYACTGTILEMMTKNGLLSCGVYNSPAAARPSLLRFFRCEYVVVSIKLLLSPVSNSVCYNGLYTELLLDNFVEFSSAMVVFVMLGLYV